jgi:IclR family KDG regulon transcriptional repressor
MVKRERSRYVVQSVSHGLDILENLTGPDDELGVTELAKRLGLHKNNIVRLLGTLEARGYVEQNRLTGNYRLGLKIFELGQSFVTHLQLVQEARPVLEKIVATCNESAYLAVLQNGDVVYLDGVETSQPVRVTPRIGWRVKAYCTAVGKVQLAFTKPEELNHIYGSISLVSYTEKTITDMAMLKSHLSGVAEQGYAIDSEEFEHDVCCVGVPVRDYTREVVAGICISGPSSRITDQRIESDLIEMMKEAGKELSHRLGYGIAVSLRDGEKRDSD